VNFSTGTLFFNFDNLSFVLLSRKTLIYMFESFSTLSVVFKPFLVQIF